MATGGVNVSKEYVREQLHSMGVRDLSENDLESYTNDFARLIQKHLQEQTPSSQTSTGESFSSANSSVLPSGQEYPTPQARPHQQRSAVFKTFPGDKENRVYPVPVSATPSPWRRPAVAPTTTTDTAAGDRHGTAYLETSCDGGGEVVAETPIIITRKRKTLRKVNGEARVFEESYSSVETSPSVGSVASGLAELSLTSLTPTDSSSSSDTSLSSSTSSTSFSSSTLSKDTRRPPHRTQCKSFIRPATANLYTGRLKKHDPVARYHYWKEVWEKEKFPGVESRNALRWQIRVSHLPIINHAVSGHSITIDTSYCEYYPKCPVAE
ncbi:hypothetical protein GBAR_LOCUS26607 [Geodia barretti]|uniref:Centriolar and ciliogenesis-associated protein HYLS1 C-terminal domain-containing protein n=1 Tax=Geodia barretti TaxID=519541 RepID=A0AA35XDA1_GEOBA|nr:hypothetical protein GBAR_LOCUS26607 [Geodia barretti]